MRLARVLLTLCFAVAILLAPRHASAWIENHVLGDEVTITVDRSGKALVEHRILFHTNGNVRFRKYVIRGVDRDAVPVANSYIIPAREALSNSLEAATPLTLKLVHPPEDDAGSAPARLEIAVDDEKGVRRGKYVLVIRYRTDLVGTGRVRRDGAFTRLSWKGPVFEDGFDNARTTLILPKGPTPPRAAEDSVPTEQEDDRPTFLSEVRRMGSSDEIELLLTYVPKGESVEWVVRIDPRSLDTDLPRIEDPHEEPSEERKEHARQAELPLKLPYDWRLLAALTFALSTVLTWLKAREVNVLSTQANAEMPSVIPFPGWVRGILAGAAFVAGLALQFVGRPVLGAASIVLAAILTAYRPARLDAQASLRRPGRWLTVSENEALVGLPRPTGGWLDFSTWRGKGLLLLVLALHGVAVWYVLPLSLWHAVLIGADSVFALALFGTGMGKALPPDMTVEPARFLSRVLRRLRRRKDLDGLRIVPRIRIPVGEVDPDEVRLLLAPRTPLRGFTSIEIGMTYAIGMGARVAMPEILLRVVADSPCDRALAAASRMGRLGRGRKKDERVVSLSPRFPTVRMTAEIAAALAIRVIDREARKDRAKAKRVEPAAKKDRKAA